MLIYQVKKPNPKWTLVHTACESLELGNSIAPKGSFSIHLRSPPVLVSLVRIATHGHCNVVESVELLVRYHLSLFAFIGS